jgi:CMP-N,N'-diacetyllegionaminic acid synthase
MNALCVVPARRGSKRLPLKNLLPLGGKPMVAYSIEAALASGVFTNVFVSTEEEEIGSIAEKCGGVVHPRPPRLADDLVSVTDVCIEVYEARKAVGDSYDAVVCLQPSSPLRTAEDIRGAWELFCASAADYLVSVTSIDPHYFHWAVHQQGEWWEMVFADKYMMERSLLPPVYRPNGSIKIGRIATLRERRNFFGPQLMVYETPEERSVHVATQYDFDVAEHLLLRLESGHLTSRKV